MSLQNQAIREAFAVAVNDAEAATCRLASALDSASAPVQKARIAKHAAAVCHGIGDLRRAADFWDQAGVADPSDGYAHWALGQLYRELGQLEDARVSFTLCLAAVEAGVDQDLLDMAMRAMAELSVGSRG